MSHMVTFAQRGKVRPHWDIDGGGSHHSVDDDLWSFLFIVGLIVLYFAYIAIKGSLSNSRDKSNNSKVGTDHNVDDSESVGEDVKKGYSSVMPIDNEEMSSEDNVNIINSIEEVPYNKWTPVGDAFTLKEICDETGMFNYGDILGDEAELIGIEFADGSSTLRIAIPFKDGTKTELKAGKGILKGYEEGDKIKINLIYGQELHKIGQKPIVRYDVWVSEEQKNSYLRKRDGEDLSTEVTEDDLANAWTDGYGVKYSKDKKRLLVSPKFQKDYSYTDRWLDSMYSLDNLDVLDKVIKDPIQRACFRQDYYKKHQEYALPKDIREYTINKDTLAICDFAFHNCDNLESIHIPKGVEVIGLCTFSGCKTLSHITIPPSVKFVDYMAFSECVELSSVTFNGSVIRFGEKVFSGCTNIESIFIPNGTKKKFEELLPEYKDKLKEHTSYELV